MVSKLLLTESALFFLLILIGAMSDNPIKGSAGSIISSVCVILIAVDIIAFIGTIFYRIWS